MVRPSRTYCPFPSRPVGYRFGRSGRVRSGVELVTSGYSDGRVAAGLAANAVSIADATCSPIPGNVHVHVQREAGAAVTEGLARDLVGSPLSRSLFPEQPQVKQGGLCSKVTTDTARGVTFALACAASGSPSRGGACASRSGKTIYLPTPRHPGGFERVGRSMLAALASADAGAAENRPFDDRADSMRCGLDHRSPGNFEHLRRWPSRSASSRGWWRRDSTALCVLPIDGGQHPHPSQREGGLPHTK